MSELHECNNCNRPFKRENKELFCGMECRILAWKNKFKKTPPGDTLEDLKYVVERTRYEAKSLKKSLDRIMTDYSDWEDRVVAIENKLREIEEDIGLEEKELNNTIYSNKSVDFDALDEL